MSSFRVVVIACALLIFCSLVAAPPAVQAQSSRPQAFSIELRLDSMSGPAIDGYITDGRLVTAQGWVPLLGGAGRSLLGNLIWQLYDEAGRPVEGHTKMRQILEVGGKEFVSFEVSTKELANGFYYLALTHQNAAQPSLAFQAAQPFEVKQPVAITSFLVDESIQGKVHRPVLYEDQAPHIFVYYHLAYDVPNVLIQLDVFDSSGKRLATRSAFKDQDPSRKVHRFGIRLTPGLIKAGERATITAQLTVPDGSVVKEEVSIEIVGLQLQVDMPERVRTGENVRFQVRLPDTFSEPYSLSFSQEQGLSFHSIPGVPGELDGTLQVAASAALGKRQVVMEVRDGAGRTASATVEFVVEQGRAVPALSPRPYRPPSQQSGGGGGIGSSPPPF